MRKRIAIWTAAGMLVALITVLIPVASELHRVTVLAEQAARLQRQFALLEEQGLRKQRNLAKWYNRNLESAEPDRGFMDAYENIWNFGGVMAWLEIPSVKLSLPVTHGAGEAAHDPSSAFPVDGTGNHTVIRLEQLPGNRAPAPGDVVYLTCLGQQLCYRVTGDASGWDERTERLTLEVGARKISCIRDQTLHLQQAEQTGKQAALAAVLAVAAPLVLCIPGCSIGYRRKRFRRRGEGNIPVIPEKERKML